jgi:hypothetical protein
VLGIAPWRLNVSEKERTIEPFEVILAVSLANTLVRRTNGFARQHLNDAVSEHAKLTVTGTTLKRVFVKSYAGAIIRAAQQTLRFHQRI